MTELSMYDTIVCNDIIDMLCLNPVWNWHINRNFPFLQGGSERVRRLYQFSKLTISGARGIVRWYECNLNETKYPWVRFRRFVIALSNEGISDLNIMKILNRVARYIMKERTNKLLAPKS